MIRNFTLCLVALISFIGIAQAQVPGTLSYQGILLQSDGSAIADGAHSIAFNFYVASSGGVSLLTRTVSVTTSKGLYTCIIGDGSAGNAALPSSVGSQQLYIGVTVDGGSELSPRAQLTTSPYSFRAETVTKTANPTGGEIAFWGTNNILSSEPTFYWNNSNDRLGVSTASPQAKLHLVGVGGVAGDNDLFVESNGTGAGTIQLRRTRGTNASPATVNVSDNLGSLVFNGYTASATNAARIQSSAESVSGANLGGTLEFSTNTNSTTLSEKMRITAAGNVGIGTISPAKKLSVAGSMEVGTGANDYQHLRLGGGNSSGFLFGAYSKYGDGVHLGYNFYNDNTTNVIPNTGYSTSRLTLAPGSISLYTGTANTEPATLGLTVTQNGVGVGTAPSYALDVSTSTSYRTLNLYNSSNVTSTRYGIYSYVVNNASTYTNYGIVNYLYPNDAGSGYGLYNYVGGTGTGSRYGIQSYTYAPATATGTAYGIYSNVANSGTGSSYILYGSNGSSGAGTDYGLYMSGEDINYFSGTVGIGTSSPSTSYKLYVSGTGYITSALWSASDVRYKKDFKQLANSLDKIKKLEGLSFLWMREENPDMNLPEGRQLGFKAQEVEKYFPELITTNENGFKAMNYGGMTPVLLEAIKEQQAQIEELKNANLALEKRLLAIEELLSKNTNSKSASASTQTEKP